MVMRHETQRWIVWIHSGNRVEVLFKLMVLTHSFGGDQSSALGQTTALSFSQSLSYRPLLHRNLPFSPQSHRLPASKPAAGNSFILFNGKIRISLTHSDYCKTYFDPTIGDPLVCRACLGGKDDESSNVEAYAVG
ncbi:hypothetical protein K1719_047139 [Acacia pycnantha]|nr:hypothetical protein K1719_047139 [Acacia pycnantha]